MMKRTAIMLILTGLVFGGIFAFQAFKAKMMAQVMASQGAQPQTVSTTKAIYTEWQPQRQAVGVLRAAKASTSRSRSRASSMPFISS
jgi:membrane fusion protein, multidrug efflux system